MQKAKRQLVSCGIVLSISKHNYIKVTPTKTATTAAAIERPITCPSIEETCMYVRKKSITG